MRYLISTIMLVIVLFLSALVIYCGYMAVADTWQWALVGLGIAMPDAVAIAILSAAYPAAKQY